MTPKAQDPASSGELLVACGCHQAASLCAHVQTQGVGPIHPAGPGVCGFSPSCSPRFLPGGWEPPRPVRELLHLKGQRALKSAAPGGRGGITPRWYLLRAGSQPATRAGPCRGRRCCRGRDGTRPGPCHPLCPHRATAAATPSLETGEQPGNPEPPSR